MQFALITQAIADATGESFQLKSQRSLSGGCINQAYVLESTQGARYFVKLNQAGALDMFIAEAEALQAIIDTRSIAAPAPICYGTATHSAYLVMEYFQSGNKRGNASALGEQLAAMHRHTQPQFGWHRDNTIGSTPQINTYTHDWIEFWQQQRLGFQLSLAAGNGYGGRLQQRGEQLLERLGAFFSDYQPTASLLHGDLWSGNYAIQDNGHPIIFDPALYYGDREADLAMTELFGGFGADFYAAYEGSWPLDAGYKVRKNLYNLYHILNHANLFGSGYAAQAERMMGSLLSEVS